MNPRGVCLPVEGEQLVLRLEAAMDETCTEITNRRLQKRCLGQVRGLKIEGVTKREKKVLNFDDDSSLGVFGCLDNKFV